MNTDNFLNKLEEFWGDFNCNNCEFAGKQYCQEKIF